MYSGETEGQDHINAYSKSRTSLGRALSNFAYAPFTHPDHGDFCSIEGYWYWLSVTKPYGEELRNLWGYQAKQVGRSLCGKDWLDSQEFKNNICKAIYAKVAQNSDIAFALADSTLPIVHYYEFNGCVVIPSDGQWIWQYYMTLRTEMKQAWATP